MDHTDHVNLLQDGVSTPGGVWADLGSGTGAFTLALAQLIAPKGSQPSGLCQSGATIHSIDRDPRALRTQQKHMRARFPNVTVHYQVADFTLPLELPPLDGVVMANSLHFVHDQDRVLRLVRSYLRPGGRLLLVEYDTDRGNVWVPHPCSYETWQAIALRAGFVSTRLLRTRPSRFLGQIYSALSLVEHDEHVTAKQAAGSGARALARAPSTCV